MADANDLINPLEEEEVLTPPTEELEPEELEEVEQTTDELEEEPLEEEEPEEPEERPISRREQLRIQDLLNRERTEEPKPRQRDNRLDYASEFQVDPDDAQRLEADRKAEAEFYYQQGLEQTKALQFQTRLEVDAPRVEAKYPILDKTNEDSFHPGLANAINTMYLQNVGYDQETGAVRDPSIRYAEFTDSIFELADEIAKSMTADTTRQVKQQAAKTGLRPDGRTARKMDLNKAPQDMTDEELQAVIKAQLG
jgi:hypothetical protein